MVVVDVLVVVEDVATLEGSDVSGSSVGTEEVVDVVVEVVVEVALIVVVVLAVVDVGAVVTTGSDGSAAPGSVGKPCASVTASAASAAAVAVSGCVLVTATAPAAVVAAVVAGLLSLLSVEQAAASRAADRTAASRKFFVFIHERPGTQQY